MFSQVLSFISPSIHNNLNFFPLFIKEALLRAKKNLVSQIARTVITAVAKVTLPPADEVFSRNITDMCYDFIKDPAQKLRDSLNSSSLAKYEISFNHGLKGKLDYVDIFYESISGNFVLLEIFQSLILTNIPKLVLSTMALKHQNLVDHKITKIVRTVLVAFVFALGDKLKGSHNGMLIPQFLNGLITASQYEKGEPSLLISFKQFISRSFLNTIFGGKYN